MSPELMTTLLMFSALVICVILGVSLSFALGAIGTVSAVILGFDFRPLTSGVFDYMFMLVLAAVPLFVYMGVVLGRSRIAEDMYNAFYLISGPLRGGLALGSSFFAAALSAMTGNCAASTVTAGVVGIPPMKKFNYKDSIIFGTIASSGSLGILIPPSITLIVIGMTTGESIGALFLGGLVAGIIMLIMFALYILVISYLKPEIAPANPEPVSTREKISSLRSVAFPTLIVVLVLGSIFSGAATPTEAASVGAVAVLLSVIVRGEFNLEFFRETTHQTAAVTGMVLWIMFGAAGFIAIYSGSGAIGFINQFMMGLDLSPWAIFAITQLFVIILGMFIDPMGIILLVLPIFFPIVTGLGFDPIWYCVIFNIGLCIGYVSPPFGYNLFYLKQVRPETNIMTIYKSVLPFLAIMLVGKLVLIIFPEIIINFVAFVGV